MQLLSIFAGLALFVAGIGIYGVMPYFVGQQTHDIGWVAKVGLRIILIGIVVGVALAIGVTRSPNYPTGSLGYTKAIQFGNKAFQPDGILAWRQWLSGSYLIGVEAIFLEANRHSAHVKGGCGRATHEAAMSRSQNNLAVIL